MSETGRFASTVEYYRRFRPRYPQAFVDDIARRLGLGGTGRLLDLGCGPAFLAIAFRRHVAEAVAMDPEPAMLAAAADEARQAGVDLVIRSGSSENLPDTLVPLRLVTMGRSFQWMEGPATLDRLAELVLPTGAVVLCWSRPTAARENRWHAILKEVGDRHAAEPGHPMRLPGHLRDWRPTLEASAFGAIEEVTHELRRTITVEEVIGFALSRSATSPERLGDRRAAFETDLRKALAPSLVDGRLPERLGFHALIARRPAFGA